MADFGVCVLRWNWLAYSLRGYRRAYRRGYCNWYNNNGGKGALVHCGCFFNADSKVGRKNTHKGAFHHNEASHKEAHI